MGFFLEFMISLSSDELELEDFLFFYKTIFPGSTFSFFVNELFLCYLSELIFGGVTIIDPYFFPPLPKNKIELGLEIDFSKIL